MSTEIIQDICDLKDPRAREIASNYGLDILKIAPNYLGLEEARKRMDLNGITMGIASQAIVTYELTKREVVQFPVSARAQEKDELELDFKISRVGNDLSFYEDSANGFRELLVELDSIRDKMNTY